MPQSPPPRLLSFDVFGTLISVLDGSYGASRAILADAVGDDCVNVSGFFEYWEERNIAHYWEPYRRYRDIAELSLGEAFAQFGVHGDSRGIQRYFDAFGGFELYPDVTPTLEILSRRYRLALVSNIDNDLLAATRLRRDFDLACIAEHARGYKPDGTLFRYLFEHAGVPRDEILHSGQSQSTDMVGAKTLSLTVAWINQRRVVSRRTPPCRSPTSRFPTSHR